MIYWNAKLILNIIALKFDLNYISAINWVIIKPNVRSLIV